MTAIAISKMISQSGMRVVLLALGGLTGASYQAQRVTYQAPRMDTFATLAPISLAPLAYCSLN
jgi:hypothetical protein